MARSREPDPAGFGRCNSCAYVKSGTHEICFACASATLKPPAHDACQVCDLEFAAGEGRCKNPVCSWPDRQFEHIWAIAMRVGELENAINRYKFQAKLGWAKIFGRVVLGFLRRNEDIFGDMDLIIASPTHIGQLRSWDHTRTILAEAKEEDDFEELPFHVGDPPVIEKTADTKPMKACSGWRERHEVATGELRHALRLPNPKLTRGQSVLVFDDVFTDGLTLNEVARCLKVDGGARRVYGLYLARQPWRGASS